MERLGFLADRIERGYGRAARALGALCDAFRPDGAGAPLAPSQLYMRLPAAFAPPDGSWEKPVGYGQALWHGIFDASYTLPGDYLVRRESRPGVGDGGIWFVAAQQKMLPPLCVRASRVVSLSRPHGARAAGVNGYGGIPEGDNIALLTDWPASVLDGGGGGGFQPDLPTATSLGAWSVLLPSVSGVPLQAGDFLADDLGRTGVVSSAELSDLGWRLSVKQAAT